MSSPKITLQTVVRRNTDVAASEVDSDLILFDLERGRYYGTQVVGRRIWEIINEPVQVGQICALLMNEFTVEREVCESEVLRFLDQLDTEGLLKIG